MEEVFQEIVARKHDPEKEEQKILVTKSSMVGYYKALKDVELSKQTLGNYGFNKTGYWRIQYPKVFDYKDTGKRTERGFIIDVEAFIDQIGIPDDGGNGDKHGQD